MGLSVDIYGQLIDVPDKPEIFEVENWGTDDPSEQYWRRLVIPEFFETVEFDKNKNLLLTAEQEAYAKKEVERCRKGFYFMNNGVLTYITGKHYFYLQWWKLENDIYPDYRDTDRRYFMFLNHWENIHWCLGVIRGKKRREGASSQACSNLIYECIFYKNSFCGLVSKTMQDSRDTFTDMVAFGYRQLPVFLMPKQLNDKDSVTEFVFAHKSTKIVEGRATVIDTDTGHRSRVNYRAPVENAYDRGRMSRLLGDEGGKWPVDVPFSKFIAKVSKTMIMGAKRVGFAELPSTVNEMTKAGGAEFKIVWDEANQFTNPGKPTVNQFVRYFSPAYDGFEGFIDKHGMSVIGEPTHEQYQYLVEKWVGKSRLTEEDIKLGAKAFLLKLREGKEGSSLEEEIRQNPFDEREMFMAKNSNCHFDAVLLLELYDRAKVMEKEVLEYGNWTWKDGNPFTEAIWEPCHQDHARWVRPKAFKIPDGPTTEKWGELIIPLNATQFIAACDPFQNSIVEVGEGSKASAGVMNRYTTEEGYQEFFNNMIVDKYHARPKMVELLHMDMALMCFAYGCQILIENKMDGGMRKFFIDNNMEAFLIRMPDKENYGIDPNSDNKVLLVNCWESYILKEGKEGKLIYADVIDDKYDGLIKFDVTDTEVSNQVMGLGWLLVANFYKKVNFRKKVEIQNVSDFFPTKKSNRFA
jgi:hypothetical protein